MVPVCESLFYQFETRSLSLSTHIHTQFIQLRIITYSLNMSVYVITGVSKGIGVSLIFTA